MAFFYPKVLTADNPYLTHEDELWGMAWALTFLIAKLHAIPWCVALHQIKNQIIVKSLI